eukprot:10892964-Alexandrium_andersonii.AAC.1
MTRQLEPARGCNAATRCFLLLRAAAGKCKRCSALSTRGQRHLEAHTPPWDCGRARLKQHHASKFGILIAIANSRAIA